MKTVTIGGSGALIVAFGALAALRTFGESANWKPRHPEAPPMKIETPSMEGLLNPKPVPPNTPAGLRLVGTWSGRVEENGRSGISDELTFTPNGTFGVFHIWEQQGPVTTGWNTGGTYEYTGGEKSGTLTLWNTIHFHKRTTAIKWLDGNSFISTDIEGKSVTTYTRK